ncbi:MAG TPA: protein kinase [Pyrinomonadaceae bacterium]|nr:protein kinase [Pyrinomonadaceae bacterium]
MQPRHASAGLAPRTRLGRYEIRSHLGAGGMGEVYLAQDTDLERTVAIKVLPRAAAAESQSMRRFIQEAKAVSALNHPNIITIFEIGKVDSVHFMATEFVEGITLFEHMKRSRMTLNEILDVAIQVASALAVAHEPGIVHRDIKPENIMLRQDGYVKVLDFGLAKLTEPQTATPDANTRELVRTKPGLILGTCQYMSPEQARGEEVDRRTDIWSLGVVMYEMITGRPPFSGKTTTDLLASILMIEPKSLSEPSSQFPEELTRIVMTALAKKRAERYQSAGDLLTDLRLLKQRLDFESGMERITRSVDESSVRTLSPAEVKTTQPVRSAPRTRRLTKATPRRQARRSIDSLAILPLANISDEPEMEYLSDGITESIINTLSQIPKLRVMARSTVFRYKGKEVDPRRVGESLGVRAVLSGEVLQLGQNLIIKAELLDVLDGSQLWGEQFNRKPDDILAVQEEISSEIAAKLRLKLSGEHKQRLKKRPTENTGAYQLYLKGRYFWNKRTEEGLRKGIEFFNQAIGEDPLYALAYVGLADSYDMMATYNLSPPKAVLDRAKAAAEKALEIDNQLAEAHTSLAKVKFDYDWDWVSAEAEFKRALELNPNYATSHHWYSLYLMAMGRFLEAAAAIKRAQNLDPLSLTINATAGLPFYWSGQPEQAIDQFKKTLELDRTFSLAHVLLGQAYAQADRFQEAVNELLRARELDDTPRVRAILGYTLAVSGQVAEARNILKELEELAGREYVSPYFKVLIYNALKQNDQALEWLEKAYEERSEWLVWLNVDPKLDALRDDSRFKDLLNRLRFPSKTNRQTA